MNRLEIIDSCRKNFNRFTREAFNATRPGACPGILDIGCGTGVPTIEIAGLTTGGITALDSDRASIDYLTEKVRKLKLEHRIKVVCGSALAIKFNEEHFDIIVAEGLFNVIGYKTGICYYDGFLKAGGYFLIHDEAKDRDIKLKFFNELGYTLIKEIYINEHIWWQYYCSCLEQKLPDDPQVRSELGMFKSDPESFRSRYYVLKKL